MKKITLFSRHTHFFRIFLGLYLIFLILHGLEMSWQAPVLVTAFAAGLLIALFGHLRHGHLAIGFLLLHMVLDGIHIGHEGLPTDPTELGFELFHFGLDVVFLVTELRIHVKHWIKWLVVIGLTLTGVWSVAAVGVAEMLVGSLGEEFFAFTEYLVIGGILGCVVSHLYRGRLSDPCECHDHEH